MGVFGDALGSMGGGGIGGLLSGLLGGGQQQTSVKMPQMPQQQQPTANMGQMQQVSAPQSGTTAAPMAPGTPLASPQSALSAATQGLGPTGGTRNVSDLQAERTAMLSGGGVSRPAGLEMPMGMTPEQERTYIASQGTYGQNPTFKSNDTIDYLRRLGLQGMLNDKGEASGLTPVEGQYFNRITGKYPNDPLDFLFGLGEYLKGGQS